MNIKEKLFALGVYKLISLELKAMILSS